jgi:hypothetical protein
MRLTAVTAGLMPHGSHTLLSVIYRTSSFALMRMLYTWAFYLPLMASEKGSATMKAANKPVREHRLLRDKDALFSAIDAASNCLLS